MIPAQDHREPAARELREALANQDPVTPTDNQPRGRSRRHPTARRIRGLHCRYERKAEHFQAFTSNACSLICYGRLTK